LLINVDAALLLSVYEEQGGIAQDSVRLAALRVEAAERLRALKMDCRTLGDWFEGLHGVSPLIMQGYRVALAANDDSSHRWFDEMQADIAGVLHDLLSRYMRRESFFEARLRAVTWDHGLTPKRSLRFKLNSRVSFPRVWYESALAAIGGQGVAPGLWDFDVPTAVACAIAWDVPRFLESSARL
jgi:hypothetical protein